MKVQIKETGEIKYLGIIDRKSGVDFIKDFIGNHNGFSNWEYNDDLEIYIVSEDDYEWWSTVIRNEEDLMDLVDELKEDHPDEWYVIDQIVSDAGNDDLEVRALYAIANLKEYFKED